MPRLSRLIARLLAPAVAASARARQRRSLLNLDARLLADVGLTRTQALHLSELRPLPGEPGWTAPAHWQVAPKAPACG